MDVNGGETDAESVALCRICSVDGEQESDRVRAA